MAKETTNTLDNKEIYEQYEFKHNFITIPWDDRTSRSKIGIITLLLAIFCATVALVVNSFVQHYKGFEASSFNIQVKCQRVRMRDYGYAVVIHSIATDKVICVGALVTSNTVLASGACSKVGPVRLRLGNPNDPHCKKGFPVHLIEPIDHYGDISKSLVLLYSYENLERCASRVIDIATNIKNQSRAHVIGRSMNEGSGRSTLSRQPVTVAGNECTCAGMMATLNVTKANKICVKPFAKCPVLAGDLLIQGGRLYGLASTSVQQRDEVKLACFTDLTVIAEELRKNEIKVF